LRQKKEKWIRRKNASGFKNGAINFTSNFSHRVQKNSELGAARLADAPPAGRT
jgi:hypothetical protein